MARLTVAERWKLLADTVDQLVHATSVDAVVDIVRPVARSIAQADGITIVKRIGEETDYLAEDAIDTLWAGMQFPIDKCLAGRAMVEEQTVIIPDITHVEGIPLNVYLATFIRSLIAVPIGDVKPTYAICAYWREAGPIDSDTVALMEALGRVIGGVIAVLEVLAIAEGRSSLAA
ncbi:GAF domain-containing protein [Sphingomonas sp. 32-62-10]|uniref:GAF domain-containing protein n=1 Tax=Sphingomonas sp. 32-62-10 TaxID=1970436 RepID=UPI000BCCBFF0|nr:MAG: hypothetical protein B7Y98_03415 [Sphingomonas sp. 32-62-10]